MRCPVANDRLPPDDDEPFSILVLDRGNFSNVYGPHPPTKPCECGSVTFHFAGTAWCSERCHPSPRTP
jgi:hypothetical protein